MFPITKSNFDELILSETKDFGVGELKSMIAKRKIFSEAFDFSSLEGAFSGLPAIVIGAGPSLNLDAVEAAGLDPSLLSHSLVLSGGSALEWLEKKGVTPHFSLLFDPASNQERFQKVQRRGDRSLFTLRANSSLVSSWIGPKWLLATEGLHLWESAWHPTQSSLDVGWNVATALAAFAEFLGCSSLLLLGVDFATGKEGELYPEGIRTTHADRERECRELEWKLGREWVQSFVERASQKGTEIFFGKNSFLPNSRKCGLDEFIARYCNQTHLIEETLQEYERANNLLSDFDPFLERIKRSYVQSHKIFDAFFETGQMELLVLEPFYQKIIHPLWRIWAPRFLEICEERKIPWMEKEQEIAFIQNVLSIYEEVFEV